VIFSLRLDNKKATFSGFLYFLYNELTCISFASVSKFVMLLLSCFIVLDVLLSSIY